MSDKLKHFNNNIEAEFWNENKKFLVQDLVLSAMVSFVKLGSVFNNRILSQLFIFFRCLSLSNTSGRTEDINENRQHLGLDIHHNVQCQLRMKVKNKNTSASVQSFWFQYHFFSFSQISVVMKQVLLLI